MLKRQFQQWEGVFETQELDVAVIDASKIVVDDTLIKMVKQSFGKARSVEL